MTDLLLSPVALVTSSDPSPEPVEAAARPRLPLAGPVPSVRAEGSVLEVLWHQRQVELTGPLHQVRVPLIGRHIPGGLSADLTALLAAWWIGGSSLSPTVQVTSVVADLQGTRATGYELVLLVTTDALAGDHSIVGLRMIRDLRRALRISRLSSVAIAAPIAA